MNSPSNRRRFLQTTALASGALFANGLSIADQRVTNLVVPGKRRMNNVNTTDIADAIQLGCRTMSSVFDETDHNFPFFASWVTPDVGLAFNPDHSESHVPGRHLNALLHAEAVLRTKIPDDVIDKHAQAAFFSFSGALPLPLNRRSVADPKPTRFLPHNLREGFHALYALTKYRHSDRARSLAERSIETILNLWDPARGWNRDAIEAKGVQLIEWDGAFITGIARAIGPLVKLYQATGHGPALELALMLKTKALTECFVSDGSYDLRRFGTHTHSTTCVMSSLGHLAELTGDGHLFERVRCFYDHGLKVISDDIGWSIENNGPQAAPDRGEINNTGDILETAMILGRRGYPEYFHHAERFLRCHLLPSQLRDISFINEPPRPDGKPTFAQRHLGAFGFPAPYGHAPLEGPANISFNMDIVGGAVDSLCYVMQWMSDLSPAGHRVHLLFDREDENLKVTSRYRAETLQVTLKKAAPLFIRVPPWLSRRDFQVSVAGKPVQGRFSNSYYVLSQPPVNVPLEFSFELKPNEATLKHRTRNIRVRLKGDSVAAMDNFGADLTFFDSL